LAFNQWLPNSTPTQVVTPGRLLLFRYDAKYAAKLKFYDKNPLCYVVAKQGNAFWGVNLHYTPVGNRMAYMRYLDAGDDPATLTGYHKYLYTYVRSGLLDIPMSDWERAFELPAQEFVRELGGVDVSVNIGRYL
tara:strand:- start:4325 stop:4726 length:402 start_codon:yes stop_codon:yes gene_type:complete